MSVVLLTMAHFCVVLFCVICVFCLLVVLVRWKTSASDGLKRLVSEMTSNVLMGTLNHTHSLTHSLLRRMHIPRSVAAAGRDTELARGRKKLTNILRLHIPTVEIGPNGKLEPKLVLSSRPVVLRGAA